MDDARDAHEANTLLADSQTRKVAADNSETAVLQGRSGAVGNTTIDASIASAIIDAPPRRRITGESQGADGAIPRARAAAPRVSVVIPTLNEADNLPHVFAELPEELHEVIVIDGYSVDGTAELAQRLRPDVRIVHQTQPGKGDALRMGFNAATGDVLVMLDADGSANPAEIPAFLDALVNGADFAKGSRYRRGGGSADLTRLRSAGNRFLSGTVNLLFGTAYSDLCYGYNAFWRHCLPAMNVDCTGFEVETLINIRVARAGLQICEVPSFERARIYGESNLRTFRDGWRVLRTILRERMRRIPPAKEKTLTVGKAASGASGVRRAEESA
jgi:glycosyltransferase involved in cell wall biosynthesis